jgi:hypothetical protein
MVCLLVEIAICEDIEVEWEQAQIAKRKAGLEVPIDINTVAAGVPLPIGSGANPRAEIAREATQVSIFKAKNGQRSIFARS